MKNQFLGSNNDDKNHGIISICGNYSNLRIYSSGNAPGENIRKAYGIINELDNIYTMCNICVKYKVYNNRSFKDDFLKGGYETLIINHGLKSQEQINVVLTSLKISDVYLDVDNEKLGFHYLYHEDFDQMIEVIFDFSLRIVACEVKNREIFLSVDSYSSSVFVDINYFLNEDYYEELKESVDWAGSIAGKIPERLNTYISDIDKYRASIRGSISDEIWCIANAFIELDGLRYVYQNLRREQAENLKEKMFHIVNGVAYKYPELKTNNDKCRNFLFELKVASDYIKAGREVSINQTTDVIVDDKYYIECKKVSSLDKLVKRLSEAVEQIKNKTKSGIIYIDASDILMKDYGALIINDKRIDFPNKNGENDTDRRVINDFKKVVLSRANKHLSSIVKKISGKLGSNILVISYSFPCIHFSPIHERVMNLTLRFVISNERNHEMRLLVEKSFC